MRILNQINYHIDEQIAMLPWRLADFRGAAMKLLLLLLLLRRCFQLFPQSSDIYFEFEQMACPFPDRGSK